MLSDGHAPGLTKFCHQFTVAVPTSLASEVLAHLRNFPAPRLSPFPNMTTFHLPPAHGARPARCRKSAVSRGESRTNTWDTLGSKSPGHAVLSKTRGNWPCISPPLTTASSSPANDDRESKGAFLFGMDAYRRTIARRAQVKRQEKGRAWLTVPMPTQSDLLTLR